MASSDNAGKSSAVITSADTVIQDQPIQDGSSDGEGGERTAREKLKKTSIAGLSQYSKVGTASEDHPLGEVTTADFATDTPPENGQARGRPSKKRSFDDLQKDDTGAIIENGGPPLPKKGAQHKRMRSRELSGDDEKAQSLDQNEDMASPVQEERGVDARQSPGGPGILVSAPSQAEMDAAATTAAVSEEDTEVAAQQPGLTSTTEEPKVHPSDLDLDTTPPTKKDQTSKIPTSSGFANASTDSPFSSFKSPKSPEQASESSFSPSAGTSTSAFASSGLSAFASSEKSPFGAVGSSAKSSGGFGSGTASSGFGSSSASGGFGSTSSFASKPATGFGSGGGFGSVGGFGGGSGFGAATKPFGGGISSFAGSSSGPAPFTKAKSFVPKNEETEEGSDEGGDEEEGANQSEKDDSQDPRFQQQERKSASFL